MHFGELFLFLQKKTMIIRELQQQILNALHSKKVVVMLGARRVGKTTLVKDICNQMPDSKYFNCELLQNRDILQTTNSELLFSAIGSYKLVIFDEAQSIDNIGLILKIIHDTFPEIRVIATGSSSFFLEQQVGEPLVGRSRYFTMTPFSYEELTGARDTVTVNAALDSILRFGMYPDVYGMNEEEAIEELDAIVSGYLLKDIFQFEQLKKPDVLYGLLKSLALQIGSQVSLSELSNLLNVHVNTVKRYIELLEQNFIIFRLPAYSKNPRNEIAKSQKIFFYDCGIRNAIIRNFNPMNIRSDAGQLFENFFISERRKRIFNERKLITQFFWRNYQQKEIDLVEDSGTDLQLFECKFSTKRKSNIPNDFAKSYTDYSYNIVDSSSFWLHLKKTKDYE